MDLRGWDEGAGPRYRRLAAAFAAAIERGELLAGTRLPPERLLAARLGVARGTVTAAYELLRDRGIVERRQGRGTEVVGAPGTIAGPRLAELATSFQRNVVFRSITQPADEAVDLLASCAPPSPPVLAEIETATATLNMAELACDNGYHPLGHPPLRRAVAAHLTALGQPTDEEEVLITNGAQQAVSLLSACYVQPGDVVVLEDPTFPGAVDAFRAAGARILTVPVRAAGADVDLLGATIAGNAVRAVYLTPTFQNPTGAVLPDDARKEIVRLSRATGVPIVEDNTLAELSFGVTPPAAMGAGDAPVISIGSLSKLFWGGLRIGWIRAGAAMIAHLGRLKAISDLGTSLVSQAIATALLADAGRVRAIRCRDLTGRLDLLADLLARHCPDWRWRRPDGGLSVWARLPRGDATEFAQHAARHGVSIAPGPVMSATGSFNEYVRLPFDHEPDVLREGIRRLGTAWAGYAVPTAGRLHLII